MLAFDDVVRGAGLRMQRNGFASGPGAGRGAGRRDGRGVFTSRIEFVVELQNPREEHYPLVEARYSLEVAGAGLDVPLYGRYPSEAFSSPGQGTQRLLLAGALPATRSGGTNVASERLVHLPILCLKILTPQSSALICVQRLRYQMRSRCCSHAMSFDDAWRCSGCSGTGSPRGRVLDAALVEETAEGSRIEFVVELQNPREEHYPLVEARYSLEVAGAGTFRFTEVRGVAGAGDAAAAARGRAAGYGSGGTNVASERLGVLSTRR